MNLELFANPDDVAAAAANLIASAARAAAAERGQFVLAVSGGRTPWQMLRALSRCSLPWQALRIVQVDERVAPAGHPDRNLTHLKESLLPLAPLAPDQIFAMPVEQEDLTAAAAEYGKTLEVLAGQPPVVDLVHLGMGPDGHTASLVPGDSVLQVRDRAVALTGVYQGRRRLTLTYPTLSRARRIVWVVTGADKASMLPRLIAGDPTIPAGRVAQEQAVLLADRAAAGNLQAAGSNIPHR